MTSPPIEIPVESRARERAGEVLAKIGFRGDLPFFVLHPGMGGSAANLTAPHYLRLLRDVEAELGAAPVLSAGPAERDQALVRELRAARPDLPVVEGLSLAELREVFRRSGLVIAPSTGPLHLAHYVGTATLGLYSPVQSQRWERWAPRGGTGKSFVLAPRIACSARRRCFGTSCPEYFCLDRMDWRGLISQAADDLKRNGGAG